MSHWAPFSHLILVKLIIPLFFNLFIKFPMMCNSKLSYSLSLTSLFHIVLVSLFLKSPFIELAPLVPPYCRSVWSVDALRSAGKNFNVHQHNGKETFHFWNKHRIDTMCNSIKVEARATHKHSMTSTLSLPSVDVSTRNSNDIHLSILI